LNKMLLKNKAVAISSLEALMADEGSHASAGTDPGNPGAKPWWFEDQKLCKGAVPHLVQAQLQPLNLGGGGPVDGCPQGWDGGVSNWQRLP
jgi:hypothetical protein